MTQEPLMKPYGTPLRGTAAKSQMAKMKVMQKFGKIVRMISRVIKNPNGS